MEVLFWIVGIAAWIGCGHVSVALRRGWYYYDLAPSYSLLGTPEEQLKDYDERGGFPIGDYLFGPIGVAPAILVFGTRPKW